MKIKMRRGWKGPLDYRLSASIFSRTTGELVDKILLNQVKYTTPGRFNPENPGFANKMLFTFSNFHKHNLCIQNSKSSILPLKVKRGNDFNPNIKTHNQILVLVNRIKKPSEGKKRQVPWLDLGRQPESSLA